MAPVQTFDPSDGSYLDKSRTISSSAVGAGKPTDIARSKRGGGLRQAQQEKQ